MRSNGLTFMLSIVMIVRTVGFNIETREPVVKRIPTGEQETYFGFSIALHQQIGPDHPKDNWILVGAPLANNLQPGVNRSGALYKCPVSENAECDQIITDGRKVEYDYEDDDDDTQEKTLYRPLVNEIKSGQWLGVTVKSQKPGGKAIVCAHRYVTSPDIETNHYGYGLCYLLNNELKVEEALEPCKGRPVEKLHQQYGFCQIGTSLALMEDGFALLGAPGPYTWRGTIFGKYVDGDFISRDKNVYQSPLNDNNHTLDKYSYLGMSVTGGRFFDRSQDSYVSGAPRSKDIGQVFLFDKIKNVEELKIRMIIDGELFASSFGYEILATDINNDGYDDLIVSAPFYYENNLGGRIYIYTNLRNCKGNDCPVQKIDGKGRFGFALTSLGDINKDGLVDVAVGAPYANTCGAVYIYLGAKNGLQQTASQVLADKHKMGYCIRTFGYSLSGGLDVDGNGYPDLAVGAYESEKVILYKTRPIIDIHIKVKGNLKNIDINNKTCSYGNVKNHACFEFSTCFNITGEVKNRNLQIFYNISEVNKGFSRRTWIMDPNFLDKKSATRERRIDIFNLHKEYCMTETLYIKDSITDFLSPIKFRVAYTLLDDEPLSPILNKTSTMDFEAEFLKNCGADNICKSKLDLCAGLSLNKTESGKYIVDSVHEDFIIQANVSNRGEDAYEAKMYISHPNFLSYIALKKTESAVCTHHNSTLVVCDLGNPFGASKRAALQLRFEVLKPEHKKEIPIIIFVNSTSTETSKQTRVEFLAEFQKVAKFKLTTKTAGIIFYGGEIKGESAMKNLEDIGAKVTHVYQIDNNGQWPLENFDVEILWPLQVSPNSHGVGKWLLYLESVPKVFNLESQDICEVFGKDSVNPLGLKSKDFMEEQKPENLMLKNISYSQQRIWRSKRDADHVAPTVVLKNKKEKFYIDLNCLNNLSAKCAKIICHIKKLSKGNQATIEVHSRIWNSTLVEDYPGMDWVSIKSQGSVNFLDGTFIIHQDAIKTVSAETIGYPEMIPVSAQEYLWIIIVAAVVGIILLIVLVFALYKCGFFKRHRTNDATLSGNLQSKEENENLLKSKTT